MSSVAGRCADVWVDIGAWEHIETSRSCPVRDIIVRISSPGLRIYGFNAFSGFRYGHRKTHHTPPRSTSRNRKPTPQWHT